ncbi:alpha/beta hydrolase [Hyaloraphidium curvatum]|nr:alpha/beta hydrolase [Hyaloraphidium curvatum]
MPPAPALRTFRLPGSGPASFIDIPASGASAPRTPLLFIHPILTNADLFVPLASRLAERGHRCVLADLPFGRHRAPLDPDARLDPEGVADIVRGIAGEALQGEEFVLVGSDTGGAIAQVFASKNKEMLKGLVLLPCDSFENFFPPLFNPLISLLAATPGTWHLRAVLSLGRRPWFQRSPAMLGWLSKRPQVAEKLLTVPCDDPAIARDLKKAISPPKAFKEYTIAAAKTFPGFGRPVLLVTAPEDTSVFPRKFVDRLKAEFERDGKSEAEIVEMADSYAFTYLDQEERTAEVIGDWLDRIGA